MPYRRIGIRHSVQDWSANGVNEAQTQTKFAKMLAGKLRARGAEVMVVGSGPTQTAGTKALARFKPEVCLSLHHDGAGACGVFAVIWRDPQDRKLRDEIVKVLKARFPKNHIKAVTDTAYSGKNLYDMTHSPYPAVLIESLDATCKKDAVQLKSDVFAKRYTDALADALTDELAFLRVGRFSEARLKILVDALRQSGVPIGKIAYGPKNILGHRHLYVGRYGPLPIKKWRGVLAQAGVIPAKMKTVFELPKGVTR